VDTGPQDARRLVVTEAARALAKDATEAARSLPAGSPGWRFYHGVETAALHVLHPEMAIVRVGTSWLDVEAPAFRRGFLEASTVLSAAATAADPPVRVHMPQLPDSVEAQAGDSS
jgi:hypothetical protein